MMTGREKKSMWMNPWVVRIGTGVLLMIVSGVVAYFRDEILPWIEGLILSIPPTIALLAVALVLGALVLWQRYAKDGFWFYMVLATVMGFAGAVFVVQESADYKEFVVVGSEEESYSRSEIDAAVGTAVAGTHSMKSGTFSYRYVESSLGLEYLRDALYSTFRRNPRLGSVERTVLIATNEAWNQLENLDRITSEVTVRIFSLVPPSLLGAKMVKHPFIYLTINPDDQAQFVLREMLPSREDRMLLILEDALWGADQVQRSYVSWFSDEQPLDILHMSEEHAMNRLRQRLETGPYVSVIGLYVSEQLATSILSELVQSNYSGSLVVAPWLTSVKEVRSVSDTSTIDEVLSFNLSKRTTTDLAAIRDQARTTHFPGPTVMLTYAAAHLAAGSSGNDFDYQRIFSSIDAVTPTRMINNSLYFRSERAVQLR